MALFKKRKKEFDWKDLFRYVLYYFSELEENKVRNISTLSFAVALCTSYTFNKKFDMAGTWGDVFRGSSARGDISEAMTFLVYDMCLYDLVNMESYFHNSCCSHWHAYLKKETEKLTIKPLKKDKKLLAQWNEFAKYVHARSKRCQRFIDSFNKNPAE